MHQRNLEGIKKAAQKKREFTLSRVNDAICELVAGGEVINFRAVATAAKVSRAFLYKEKAIKSRIIELRKSSGLPQGNVKTPLESQDSNLALILTLRERIRQLEAEAEILKSDLYQSLPPNKRWVETIESLEGLDLSLSLPNIRSLLGRNRKERIFDYLKSNPPSTTRTISTELGIPQVAVNKHANSLEKKGLVRLCRRIYPVTFTAVNNVL